MYRSPLRCHWANRPGAATVEFAVLAPFLAYIFLLAVDYGRVFYYSVTVQNAARKGALYGCQDAAHSTDTSGIQTAALADATDITPPASSTSTANGGTGNGGTSGPTVTSATAVDKAGNPTVRVTVQYTLHTVANYPGIPSTIDLNRTVTMRVLP
jgi:Flp pilus assembly protein TadG